MNILQKLMHNKKGLTLVEVLITALTLGIVLAVVSRVFISSNNMYGNTNRRAEMQMNVRLGMGIMAKDIRHAGCDPAGMGIVRIVYATADTIRVQSDLDGDGAISTVEPSEDVTYFFDPNVNTLFRDPGTGPQVLIPDVNNVAIVYRDASNNVLSPLPLTPQLAARVRSVTVTITTRARESEEFTLSTAIALRNI